MRKTIGLRAFVIAALAVAVNQVPAAAQRGAPPSAPSPAPSPTRPPSPGIPTTPTPNTPSPNNPFPQPGTQQNPYPETQRPIYLSGKVVMEDGSVPPDTVTIMRVCASGTPRPEAYTDTKGHFSFQFGENRAMIPDASVGGPSPAQMGRNGGFGMGQQQGISDMRLMNCDIQASLAGYRSESVHLAGRRAMENPDVGIIILHRIGNVEGNTISMTSLEAPKDARKAYDKARDELRKRKLDAATKELRKAVAIYPKYAAAWYTLGNAMEAGKDPGAARDAYNQAVAADPKYVQPYVSLAGIALREKKWQDAVDNSNKAIRLDPFDIPQAYLFNAYANLNLGNSEAAEKSASEAAKIDTRHQYPASEHMWGMLLANRHQYASAAEHLRNYLKFEPDAQNAATVRSQLSELDKLAAAKPAQ